MIISSLRNQREFDLVNKIGKKYHSTNFILVITQNFQNDKIHIENSCFLGMKVTKKLGNAVIRNKIKRRIRHAFRLIIKETFQKSGFGLIFIPKKDFDKLIFLNILAEFRKIISQIKC